MILSDGCNRTNDHVGCYSLFDLQNIISINPTRTATHNNFFFHNASLLNVTQKLKHIT